MNYGPLEFARYLHRRTSHQSEPDTVVAARAAAPDARGANRLTIISGPRSLPALARHARIEAVSIYQAVATLSPKGLREVRVSLRRDTRPVVLVLSSHEAVQWQIDLAPGAVLEAVLLSGYRDSTVSGNGTAAVARIGGFYAFRRGSAEFRQLESEVLRCTGRTIENFQSVYAGSAFEVGP